MTQVRPPFQSGELNLHRASYDRYHQKAVESGAIILHQCGYDSVPSDLTAFLASKAMRERHGCMPGYFNRQTDRHTHRSTHTHMCVCIYK